MFDTTQLKLYDHTQGPRKIGPDEGYSVQLPGVGVRFMAWTEETGGGFSMVEHPIAPRTMAAPWHMHTREDEYSYVLEGRWARCWATTRSTPSPATSCSSLGTSGTRSGTPATSHAGSSRSSLRAGSSTCSARWAS